jgi:para-nitrobenzyl esterase
MPVVHPATIPREPLAAPAVQPQVDVLIGTNADEATFFYRQPGRVVTPDDDALMTLVGRLPGVFEAPATIARYRERLTDADNTEILVRIATDSSFAAPVARWASQRADAGARVHRYRLDHRSPQPGLGAMHTIGVPLLFGSHASSAPGAWTAGQGPQVDRVSHALRAAWRAFVHDGDPGWPPLRPGGDAMLGVLGGGDGGLRAEPIGAAGRA